MELTVLYAEFSIFNRERLVFCNCYSCFEMKSKTKDDKNNSFYHYNNYNLRLNGTKLFWHVYSYLSARSHVYVVSFLRDSCLIAYQTQFNLHFVR